MAVAEIGALRVVLSLNAGEFSRGLRKAETEVRGFGSSLAAMGSKMTALIGPGTAVAAIITGVAAALGVGIKKTIDAADAMDELSQKLGIAVSDLSKLKTAAELSGVPLEQFTTGVTKLSQAMQDIASGETGGAAARALAALGVSATDSTGQLRGADLVMIDIAERFSGLADGAGKTALAMDLFGKSGAQLIPFLNQGRDGIASLSAEAQELGGVLSGQTAAAAGKFNESIDKLGIAVRGVFNAAVRDSLPALTELSERLLQAVKDFGLVEGAAGTVSGTIKFLADQVIRLQGFFGGLSAEIKGWSQAVARYATGDAAGAQIAVENVLNGIRENADATTAALNRVWQTGLKQPAFGAGGASGLQGFGDTPLPNAPTPTSAAAETEAKRALTEAQTAHNTQLAAYNALRSQGLAIEREFATPQEQMMERMAEIQRLFDRGALSAETYGRAMAAAGALSSKNMDAMASSISGSLSAIFGESKAVAIATALINTYQGITRALATYPPPIAQVMAGIQAAAGFAQVAKIRSMTSKGGGGGGSGGGGGGEAAAAPAAAPQQSMFVSGFRSDEFFSGDTVRALAGRLVDFQKNGGQVVFAGR